MKNDNIVENGLILPLVWSQRLLFLLHLEKDRAPDPSER